MNINTLCCGDGRIGAEASTEEFLFAALISSTATIFAFIFLPNIWWGISFGIVAVASSLIWWTLFEVSIIINAIIPPSYNYNKGRVWMLKDEGIFFCIAVISAIVFVTCLSYDLTVSNGKTLHIWTKGLGIIAVACLLVGNFLRVVNQKIQRVLKR